MKLHFSWIMLGTFLGWVAVVALFRWLKMFQTADTIGACLASLGFSLSVVKKQGGG